MKPSYPIETDLVNAIEIAARTAIKELFARHPGRFYYLSLVTTGEAHPPVLAAWSEEALEEAVKGTDDRNDARWGLKWSYADSPFYCFGEHHFEHVNRLFDLRPDIHSLDGEERIAEYGLRLRAMEEALLRLDQQGVFGTGGERLKIVINVEVVPPDFTNTQRAKRLNPPEAIRCWLEEAAEDDDC